MIGDTLVILISLKDGQASDAFCNPISSLSDCMEKERLLNGQVVLKSTMLRTETGKEVPHIAIIHLVDLSHDIVRKELTYERVEIGCRKAQSAGYKVNIEAVWDKIHQILTEAYTEGQVLAS